MSSLSDLSVRKIRSLAGDLWFARGEAYFEQGRVRDLTEHQGTLTATVTGTQKYRVRLWIKRGEIASSCTCPLGDDEQFCAVIDKEKLAAKPAKTYQFWRREVDHSQLVEIFLWEKNYEDAWQEATAGGCADHPLLELADATAKEHPKRALPVYRELIAPTLNQTNNQAYDQAIKLLRKLRQVMSALNRHAEFDDYLIALRVEYKRKRNFIKLLDGAWK